jgi:cytochrome P450
MVRFPQVQREAQAELDRVVNGRFPDFGDIEDLPYLTAVMKEVIRSVASYCILDEHSYN